MWRRVVLVRTEVSEGNFASIFRVEKYAGEEQRWQLASRLPRSTFTAPHPRRLSSYVLCVTLSPTVELADMNSAPYISGTNKERCTCCRYWRWALQIQECNVAGNVYTETFHVGILWYKYLRFYGSFYRQEHDRLFYIKDVFTGERPLVHRS
jgi:hypothetical protein